MQMVLDHAHSIQVQMLFQFATSYHKDSALSSLPMPFNTLFLYLFVPKTWSYMTRAFCCSLVPEGARECVICPLMQDVVLLEMEDTHIPRLYALETYA